MFVCAQLPHILTCAGFAAVCSIAFYLKNRCALLSTQTRICCSLFTMLYAHDPVYLHILIRLQPAFLQAQVHDCIGNKRGDIQIHAQHTGWSCRLCRTLPSWTISLYLWTGALE